MEGVIARRFCCRELLPFTAMMLMEGTIVGMNTLFKAAASRGMSNYVFMVYSYAISTLVLLPSFFIFIRSGLLPSLNFSVICKIGLLGLSGYSSMILGYIGISFSSPALASAISSLVPAFTFIFATIFRMEKLDLRSKSSQAKIAGTMVSIVGAFVVTLYKGPPILLSPSPSPSHQPLHSLKSNWVTGSLLLIAQYLQYPLWYFLQCQSSGAGAGAKERNKPALGGYFSKLLTYTLKNKHPLHSSANTGTNCKGVAVGAGGSLSLRLMHDSYSCIGWFGCRNKFKCLENKAGYSIGLCCMLRTVSVMLEHCCSHMGTACEGTCLCSNVQAFVNSHCSCHGCHVPWRYSPSGKCSGSNNNIYWILHCFVGKSQRRDGNIICPKNSPVAKL